MEQIQNNLATENDDRIFRLLLPNFSMFLRDNSDEHALIRFLRHLKALVRSLNGVCLISLDEDLMSKSMVGHIVYLADTVLKLTSFKDHQEMKIGDYDGTVKILKQPKLHGLISHMSEFDIYALRLKAVKTGIAVEKIHLDPEEDRSG